MLYSARRILGGAGIALALAFPPYGLWPLSLLTVAALSLLTRGRTFRQGAWTGFAFGWPFFVVLLKWLHVVGWDAVVGLAFIESLINEKEGHIAGKENAAVVNYATSINVMALAAANRGDKYKAVIGNAAEHWVAVYVAAKDKMDLAVNIAVGSSIHDLPRLRRLYGRGRWRKLKGIAVVRLRTGRIRKAHWYEAHGIGRKEIKRKRYVDQGA